MDTSKVKSKFTQKEQIVEMLKKKSNVWEQVKDDGLILDQYEDYGPKFSE